MHPEARHTVANLSSPLDVVFVAIFFSSFISHDPNSQSYLVWISYKYGFLKSRCSGQARNEGTRQNPRGLDPLSLGGQHELLGL